MRIARQLVNFALGAAVGLCLYFLPKTNRVSKPSSLPSPLVAENHSGAVSQSRANQGPKLLEDVVHEQARVTEHHRSLSPNLARTESPLKLQPVPTDPQPQTAIVNVSSETPAPLSLKPLGYVEKADGQVEAIIPQENEVQVVHIGDLISGRYRVVKITPDSVGAIDETLVQSAMTKPSGGGSAESTASVAPAPAAPATAEPSRSVQTLAASAPPVGPVLDPKALGYVQRADGTTDTVIAEADTVQLVPETPAEVMAQTTPAALPEPASGNQGLPYSAQVASLDVGMQPEVVASSSEVPADFVPGKIRRVADGSALRISGATLGGEPPALDGLGESASSYLAKDSVSSGGQPVELPVMMLPLGYVVKEDGSFAAIVSKDGEIYVVGQGDRFAGRYRAVSVSAETVEALEDSPWQAHPPPLRAPPEIRGALTASARARPEFLGEEGYSECELYDRGEVSLRTARNSSLQGQMVPVWGRLDKNERKVVANDDRTSRASFSKDNAISPGVPTYAFETLGYVQTQDGEMRAIVADESELYLVKQGETFAGHYRAISVDPALVLAAQEPAGEGAGSMLSFQAESQAEAASKGIEGLTQFPLSELANLQALHANRALGTPSTTDLGPGFLNYSMTGVGFDSQFFMSGNPNVGF